MEIKNEIFLEKIELDKTCCFDWFSCTFGCFKIDQYNLDDSKWSINNIELYKVLLKHLTITKHSVITSSFGKNGYAVSLQLFEGCSIYYGGQFTKNSTNEFTLMIDITGQGCRNFESRGGNWFELFTFCRENNYSPGRLDQAIDDYTGNEITIKEVFDLICIQKSYSALPRKANSIMSWEKKAEESISTGITINLGNRSSKCSICIYDKLQERRSKSIIEKVSYHVRYEMRFRYEMAGRLIDEYLIASNNNPDNFLLFISTCLYSSLDIKEPEGRKRITDRVTHEGWAKFLGKVKKINLYSKQKPITSLDKKELWFRDDLPATLLELIMTKGDNLPSFINEVMLDKLKNSEIPQKTLHRINAYYLEKYGVIDAFDKNTLLEYFINEIEKRKDNKKCQIIKVL